jgi:hypothetical protein
MDRLKAAGPMADQLKKLMEAVKMNLDLKKDMTFSMASTFMNKDNTTTGTWSLSNNQVVLTPTSGTSPTGQVTPISAGKTVKFTPSADAKTLTFDPTSDPAAAAQASVTFTRA